MKTVSMEFFKMHFYFFKQKNFLIFWIFFFSVIFARTEWFQIIKAKFYAPETLKNRKFSDDFRRHRNWWLISENIKKPI